MPSACCVPAGSSENSFFVVFCVSPTVAFLLLFLPFVPHSFSWGLIPSSTPRWRPHTQGLLECFIFLHLLSVNVKAGLRTLHPPLWPSRVCSPFCVPQCLSCRTQPVFVFVLGILMCVCTFGPLEWITVADVQPSQLADFTIDLSSTNYSMLCLAFPSQCLHFCECTFSSDNFRGDSFPLAQLFAAARDIWMGT